MIFLLIALIILAYSWKNFKQGFLCYLIYRIFLVTNLVIFAVPGLPILTIQVFMTLVLLWFFYLKQKSLDMETRPFPLKVPYIWLIISWTLSSIFAFIGFLGEVTMLISNITTNLAAVWLMWLFIRDKQDVLFLAKWFTIAFAFTVAYGYYEQITQSNPIVAYESTMIDSSRAVTFISNPDGGRGYRIQSIFEASFGAAVNWCMYFLMVFMLIIKYNWRSKCTKLAIVTSLLSIPCILFTKTRTPIVFMLIAIWAIFNLKSSKFYRYLAVVSIIVAFAIPLFAEYFDIILSVFDSNAQAEVQGSNAEMRFNQLLAAYELMMQSPIVGLGAKFSLYMRGALADALLGMESVWFATMTQYGILGIIANLILCYYTTIKLPRMYKSHFIFFLSLAYWITSSLTSIPGLLLYMYYMLIIIDIKLTLNRPNKCPKYQ